MWPNFSQTGTEGGSKPPAGLLAGAPAGVPPEAGDERQEFYLQVARVLHSATDLGLDNVARTRLEPLIGGPVSALEAGLRELIGIKCLTRVQLARAMARTNKMRELMSVLDIPPEGFALRQTLQPKLKTLYRAERIVPIALTKDDAGNITDLHLGHDSPVRDLVVEAKIRDYYPPEVKLHWHFCLREVAGAFWLSGENETIDAGMEAEALLDRLVSNAIDSRASDIHVDPSIKGEPRAVIKYRIDGFVHPKEVITLEQLDRLRVRIENLARMP